MWSWDSIIGIAAVVIGTILGYLASYMNNRQQRKWQLDSEYRGWRRAEIEKDMESMFVFVRRYTALAHSFVEYADSPNDPMLKDLFDHTKTNAIKQMRDEKPFPVGLKHGSTKPILEELDKVTDYIVEIAIGEQKPEHVDMRMCLEKLRELEKSLYSERQKMIETTFH